MEKKEHFFLLISHSLCPHSCLWPLRRSLQTLRLQFWDVERQSRLFTSDNLFQKKAVPPCNAAWWSWLEENSRWLQWLLLCTPQQRRHPPWSDFTELQIFFEWNSSSSKITGEGNISDHLSQWTRLLWSRGMEWIWWSLGSALNSSNQVLLFLERALFPKAVCKNLCAFQLLSSLISHFCIAPCFSIISRLFFAAGVCNEVDPVFATIFFSHTLIRHGLTVSQLFRVAGPAVTKWFSHRTDVDRCGRRRTFDWKKLWHSRTVSDEGVTEKDRG